MKILSIHDLQIIRKRAEHNLSLREESNEKVSEKCCGLASGTKHLQILICGGTGCKASSSQGIMENLQKAIERNGITDKVDVITVGCFGFCEKGPIVKIIPDNTFYTQVTVNTSSEDEESNGCSTQTRKPNRPSVTPNTWTSIGSNFVSHCATADLSTPKI